MTEPLLSSPYRLLPDEKAVPLMVYTATSLVWGEVVVKEVIRVSVWLRTNAAPERLCLYNARQISAVGASAGTGQNKPVRYLEIHIPASQVLACHLAPPAQEPLDYDPQEPNRRMQPVIALVGPFQIEGSLRLASQTTLSKYLDGAHDTFTSLYSARISNPSIPGFGSLTAQHILARLDLTVFAVN